MALTGRTLTWRCERGISKQPEIQRLLDLSGGLGNETEVEICHDGIWIEDVLFVLSSQLHQLLLHIPSLVYPPASPHPSTPPQYKPTPLIFSTFHGNRYPLHPIIPLTSTSFQSQGEFSPISVLLVFHPSLPLPFSLSQVLSPHLINTFSCLSCVFFILYCVNRRYPSSTLMY